MARRSKNMNVQGSRVSRRGGRKQARGGGVSMPPPFRATIACSHRFRFENTVDGGTSSVYRKDLLNLYLCADSSTSTVRVLEAVRLKSVEVWANPAGIGSPPTAMSIEWQGENAPSTITSDTAMGVRPAHIRSLPPPMSSSKWWSMSGQQETDPLFTLRLPDYCIIDIVCELRFVDIETPVVGQTGVGLTLGRLYGGYLDGYSTGNTLKPVGITKLA